VEPHDPTYAATVAHRLTSVLLILSVVFAVFMTIDAIGADRDDIRFEATAPLNEKLIPDGLYATSEQRTGIAIVEPSAREQRLALGIDLLPLALWIAVLWLLRGIARSVRDGDPFVGANVQRLRVMGGLLILGVIAVHVGQTALQNELLEPYTRAASAPLNTPGLRPPDGEFPGTPLLCGLGVIVLAQVFAHGVRLREDVDATI